MSNWTISTATPDYLAGLNEPQRDAASTSEGPLLILAGAGSGKTRVITYRIAHLIANCNVRPENILAVTFTNKAAGEMKERVEKLLTAHFADSQRTGSPLLSTFHSLCVRILRRDIERLGRGYTRSFTIYDTDDQQKVVRNIMKDLGYDDKSQTPRSIQSAISAAKNKGEDPKMFAARYEFQDERKARIARIYARYEQQLQNANAVDFDDLLIRTVQLLRHDLDTRDYYHNRFRHVMVDEFQDTNGIQYELVRMLVEGREFGTAQLAETHWNNRSLCVVGDDGQCIPEGAIVLTPTGSRPIEELKVGDEIIAASGHSRTLISTIDRVKFRKHNGKIFTIKTASGKKFTATPNHILYSRLNPLHDKYFVYLMYRRDKGYRIGITTGARDVRKQKCLGSDFKVGLLVRSSQELADKMWILKVCDSRSEASFHEALYAARYGLPTMVFHLRGRKKMIVTQEQVDQLYAEIDTRSRVQQLFDDFCLLESHPHLTPKSRFESERFYVNLTMFGDSRTTSNAPWGGHRIQFGTTELSLRPLFEEAGFPCRAGKRYTWRHESARINFGEATQVVEKMQDLDSRIAVRKTALLVEGVRSFAETPASHFHPGMSIAVEEQGQIIEDIVTEVTSEDYDGLVYDLDIANVHNFICEQVVCHNSIYAFRGSDFRILLGYQKDYKTAKVVKLEENYRSTKHILDAANKVIANNKDRIEKTLYTNSGEGAKIRYSQVYDGDAEARFVVSKIEEHQLREPNLKAAILYRTNAQSRLFEEACRRAGLRYNLVGGFSFYDRAEVKDVIAYLKLAMNTADSIALSRIINVPTRSIGKTTMDEIERRAAELGVSHWEAIAYVIDNQTLPARATTALQSFRDIITNLVSKTQTEPLSEIVKAAVIDTGYERALKMEGTEEAEARLLNLEELVNAAAEAQEQGEALRDFLDHAALVSDTDQFKAEAQVTLMTMHAAKGLEFPLVFIAGLEENLFPHSRVRDNAAELEEERRLCYVAITRAERFLYITHALKRRVYGEEMPAEPSRFLMEFPIEIIEDISKGPSWLSFSYKNPTAKDHNEPGDLRYEYDEPYQQKRTSNYSGRTYNDADSVRDFFARKNKPAAPPSYSRPASNSTPRLVPSSPNRSASSDSGSKTGFTVGTRVRHAKYGQGLIIKREGDGDDAKLTINFPGFGTKKMIAKFAGLEKI